MKFPKLRLLKSVVSLPTLAIGIGIGVVAVFLAGFVYLRAGFFDSRADIPINPYEKAIAGPALDASVTRMAPNVPNPINRTESNLVAGMKVYQSNCAGCHGDILHPTSSMAQDFYPRPPQFVKHSPDKPVNQNFFIVKNGIRVSGMPAWQNNLNDHQIWLVVTFLSRMDKLPQAVSDQWKTSAGSPSEGQ